MKFSIDFCGKSIKKLFKKDFEGIADVLEDHQKTIRTLQQIVIRNETKAQAVEAEMKKRIEMLEKEVLRLSDIDFYKNTSVFQEMKKVKKHADKNLKESLEAVELVKETIKNTVAIAVDVNRNSKYDSSWAVVCLKVHGQTVIEHINLAGDQDNVYKFLRQYAFAERQVDSPFRTYEFLYKS